MTDYALGMVIGSLLCFALFAVRLGFSGQKAVTALPALALSALLAALLSKVGYVLLMANRELANYGWGAFVRFRPELFCFTLGAVGAVLGTVLASRLMRRPVTPVLDAFAPVLALLVMIFRLGEHHLGMIGAGNYVEAEGWLAGFPFTLQNAYGEHYWAVYMLEVAVALLIALFAQSRKGSFSWTVLLLALTQILLESLRAKSMKWGFVRVEQVLCALLTVGMLVHACSHGSARRRWLTVPGAVLLIAVVGFMEFALEKTNLPNLICYGLMLLSLTGVAGLYAYASAKEGHHVQ